MILPSFLFPRYFDFRVAGPEEAKNLAGKKSSADSNPFSECRVWKKSGLLVKQTRRKRRSQIRGPEKQSSFRLRAQ
jgi:hypothetical protein